MFQVYPIGAHGTRMQIASQVHFLRGSSPRRPPRDGAGFVIEQRRVRVRSQPNDFRSKGDDANDADRFGMTRGRLFRRGRRSFDRAPRHPWKKRKFDQNIRYARSGSHTLRRE